MTHANIDVCLTLARRLRPATIRLFFTGGSGKSARNVEKRAFDVVLQASNRRIAFIALAVVVLDQVTKQIVLRFLSAGQEKVIIDGFFRFVYWGNTGAAWSLFRGRNALLALVAVAALVILFLNRRHFDAHTLLGQVALGLVFGGIIGNLVDRLTVRHVIDFIYFYLQQRPGGEIGFPAFNVADSSICTGVGLIFIVTWRSERGAKGTGPNAKAGAAAPR
jgi:signal peptidase II